jgi:hypothetical protein
MQILRNFILSQDSVHNLFQNIVLLEIILKRFVHSVFILFSIIYLLKSPADACIFLLSSLVCFIMGSFLTSCTIGDGFLLSVINKDVAKVKSILSEVEAPEIEKDFLLAQLSLNKNDKDSEGFIEKVPNSVTLDSYRTLGFAPRSEVAFALEMKGLGMPKSHIANTYYKYVIYVIY